MGKMLVLQEVQGSTLTRAHVPWECAGIPGLGTVSATGKGGSGTYCNGIAQHYTVSIEHCNSELALVGLDTVTQIQHGWACKRLLHNLGGRGQDLVDGQTDLYSAKYRQPPGLLMPAQTVLLTRKNGAGEEIYMEQARLT